MRDYASAVAAVVRRQQADRGKVAPGGHSILLTHGRRTPTAVVLLHGFSNSPLQFDSLGRILYRAGDNVYIPRLPYHGERTGGAALFAHITAEGLRAMSDSVVDAADGLGDTVVVVGLSLGGTMAAWVAQYRDDVRRVVIVAPLIALANVSPALEMPLVNLTVRLPNYTRAGAPDRREPDRELGWSTRAVGQILRLGLAVRRASAREAPASRDIAVLLNAHDRTIAAAPVLAMARRWAGRGAAVDVYQLPDTLGLPHDVIDPRQAVRRLDVVYPAIAALVRGDRPSSELEELVASPVRR
jgi:esterase/lipase